jgi:hypothetical protein
LSILSYAMMRLYVQGASVGEKGSKSLVEAYAKEDIEWKSIGFAGNGGTLRA